MSTRNYYDIVGVKKDANEKDIKTSFRNRAKTLHPDSASGNNSLFMELREAYDVLIDPVRRRDYDKSIAPQEVKQPQPPQQRADYAPSNEKYNQESVPKDKKKVYSLSFLMKIFIHIWVAFAIVGIESYSWLWMDKSFYLGKVVELDMNTILSVILTSSIFSSGITYLFYNHEITSLVVLYYKLFGMKVAQAYVALMSKRPKKIYSIFWTNWVSLGSIAVGVGVILYCYYTGIMQNWHSVLGIFMIIGGIFGHIRIVFGLYYLYTLSFMGIVIGIIVLMNPSTWGLTIGIFTIIFSAMFVKYLFDRRFLFY